MNGKFKIVVDKEFGYKRVSPTPSCKYIKDFYDNQYYEMAADGTGKPDQLVKFMGKDADEAEKERLWLRGSIYEDIVDSINRFAPGKSVLDVGCGTGELMLCLKDAGFDVYGVEQSPGAVSAAKIDNIANMTIEEFSKKNKKKFDAITIISVLEHVPDPSDIIEKLKMMLNKDGILCVVVPNDFSDIQNDAKKALNKKDDWWVSTPDHLNYFNFKSLSYFLDKKGFNVCHKHGDFPMELFLLMGYDYVRDKDIGKKCHNMRIKLEKSLSPEVRKSLYGALSQVGISRICFMVGSLR